MMTIGTYNRCVCVNKNAQLLLTNPRDAKQCQKLLQFNVKTSHRQINNLFEVMEIRCLVIKFLIQITSTYGFAFQMYEIARNSKKIRTYSSSRSSKVIDLGVNRMPMYLVINSNFGRISYRFRDIDV